MHPIEPCMDKVVESRVFPHLSITHPPQLSPGYSCSNCDAESAPRMSKEHYDKSYVFDHPYGVLNEQRPGGKTFGGEERKGGTGRGEGREFYCS